MHVSGVENPAATTQPADRDDDPAAVLARLQSAELAQGAAAAAKLSAQAVLDHPGSRNIAVRHATLQQAAGDLHGAAATWASVLNGSPTGASATDMCRYGLLLSQLGRHEDAGAIFSTVTRRFPHLAQGYDGQAINESKRGDWKAAFEACQTALTLDGDRPAKLMFFATICEKLGYAYLAILAMRRAADIDPSFRSAWLARRRTLLKAGQYELIATLVAESAPQTRGEVASDIVAEALNALSPQQLAQFVKRSPELLGVVLAVSGADADFAATQLSQRLLRDFQAGKPVASVLRDALRPALASHVDRDGDATFTYGDFLFLFFFGDEESTAQASLLGRHFTSLSLSTLYFVFWERNVANIAWLRARASEMLLSLDAASPAFNFLLVSECYGFGVDARDVAGWSRLPGPAAVQQALAYREAHRVAPEPSRRARGASGRLRLAVCVSGQLRGFREATPTWSRLLTDEVECTYFVSAWETVGRKRLTAAHADRSLPPGIDHAYRRVVAQYGVAAVEEHLPTVMAEFERSDLTTVEEVQDWFKTPHVQVLRETEAEGGGLNNQEKMHFQIEQAYLLALQSRSTFDLMLRIRGDKPILQANVDWADLSAACGREAVIFADRDPLITPWLGYATGDQVALGSPRAMASFSQAYSWHKQNGGRLYGVPAAMGPHHALAFSTFYRGVRIRRLPDVELGHPLDPEPMTLTRFSDLLDRDRANRDHPALAHLAQAVEVARTAAQA